MLLLHRILPAVSVVAGMNAALASGSVDADLVAVEARRSELTHVAAIPVVVPPSAGAIAAIPRPTPTLAGYDQLLREVTA